MSAPYKTYRVYSFDSVHHVLSSDLLQAADDENAIAMAEAAGFGSKCEIWDGRRMVAQLADERREA